MSRQAVEHKPLNWRLALVAVAMICCAAAVIWKTATLHVVEKEFLQGQGDARTIRTEPLVAHRGIITDRNGEALAVSTPVQSIWINPKEINLAPADFKRLAAELELDPAALQASIAANASKEFLYVRRRLPPADAKRILDLGLGGVYARQEYRRYYPHGEVAAHVVGFSNVDDVGQEGMELAYDDWLRGVPGRKQVMKDRRGRIIKEINTIQTAQPGQRLELSLDLRIQNLAYRELKEEFVHRRARSASVVVMDVNTGEVLAMVNQPSFNPHSRANLSDFGALRNRAVTDVFEPGSTVKAFTVAAALETGLFTAETIVDTAPGYMRVGRDQVDDHGSNFGELTVEQVITKSSNVGSTKIALAMGEQPLRDLLARVGFGEATGTGFPGERSGVLPNHRVWHDIERATLSFGYGLSTSALQLAHSYTVLASGGIKTPVSLLKVDPMRLDSLPRERVIDEDIALRVLEMLETVVDREKGGTATEANVPFYRVAGKTGTAHVVGAQGYEEDLHNSLFAGIAPASDPRIVVVVIVNEPQGDEHYGGQVAAPVFSRIAAGAMRILNISPDRVNESEVLNLSSL